MPRPSADSCPIAPELSVPHLTVGVVLGIDWEGTLHDPAVGTPRLQRAIAANGGPNQTDTTSNAYYRAMHTASWLPEDNFLACGEMFVADDGEASLYGDALDFLARIQSDQVPHLVVTAADKSVWPLARVAWGMRQLARRGQFAQIHTELSTYNAKGRHLAEWRGPNGTYDLIGHDASGQPVAVLHAASTHMIDDRRKSLVHLPTDSSGTLVRRIGNEEPHPDFADRITVVRSLAEVSFSGTVQHPATCSPVRDPSHASVTYRPAYPEGTPAYGTLITAETSFSELLVDFTAR